MHRIRPATFAAMLLSLLLAPATRAAIVTSFEAPGVQTSSAADIATIDFGTDPASQHYYGSQSFSLPGGTTATYNGNQFVEAAGEYGGAGGTGSYLGIQIDNSVTLTLNTPQAYFGLWFSAADPFNEIQIYNGSTLLKTFTGTGPEMTNLSDSYKGNPNPAFSGQNGDEKYAFVNFYAQTSADLFNKIVFTNGHGNTEFESDNHTFSTTLQPPSVPEPSTMASIGIAMLMFSGRWIHKKRRAIAGR